MRCPEASELVSQRLDGALSAEADASLAEHLGECPDCSLEAEMLSRLDMFLTSAPPVAPAPFFAQRVMARVQRRRRWVAIIQGGLVLLLAMAVGQSAFLLPLLSPASPVGGLARSSPFISAMAGLLVRVVGLASTLLGAGARLGEAFVGAPAYLALAGLMLLAAVLALVWLKAVGRASLAIARQTS